MKKRVVFSITIICIIIGLHFYLNKSDKTNIENKVKKEGGKLLSSEQAFVRMGPFYYKNKDQRIYTFKYKENGKIKEGWMRTGVFFDDYVFEDK